MLLTVLYVYIEKLVLNIMKIQILNTFYDNVSQNFLKEERY